MPLTPVDIANKQFPVRLRGYDRDAVDDFLDQVVQEFEALIRENASLREQVENLNQRLEQYRNLEQTINRTLVLAEESAEQIRENARREAELLLSETRAQVERMLEAGQEKARQILADNADLIRVLDTLRTQVRALLKSQLDALDGLPDPLAHVAAARLSEPRTASGDAAAERPARIGELRNGTAVPAERSRG